MHGRDIVFWDWMRNVDWHVATHELHGTQQVTRGV
jgi:hypothetical protein